MSPTDHRRTTWLAAERLALAGLLVFTLLVRGGALWAMRGNLQQDPDAYREIAENLLRHGEFAFGKPNQEDEISRPTPTAYRPPLYPVVLSNLPSADRQRISLVKVAGLHILLGVATVWLTWLTAERLFAGNESAEDLVLAPLLAGFGVACDPILLNQQTLVMTETLAAFLAILALWVLARFDGDRSWCNAGLAGGAIGLAVLCRPTFVPWLALVGLAMLVLRGKSDFRFQISDFKYGRIGWRLANAAGLAIAAAAVISPWIIRNYRVFGTPIVTTTHGGYTLLLGNNGQFYRYLQGTDHPLPWSPAQPFPDYDLVAPPDTAHHLRYGRGPKAEFHQDLACYEISKRHIRKNPGMFVVACVYRFGQLWSPLPHRLTADESVGRQLLRYATCAWYCGVYLSAAIGVWRLRWKLFRPPWVWGVLLCLAFTVVHTFYWTNLRMRAPLVPFAALVAAAGVGNRRL